MYVRTYVCVWHHLQSDLARLEYELQQLRENSAEQLRNQKRSLTASLEEVWSTRMRWEGKTLWTWSHLVPSCACHCVSQVVDWCSNNAHCIACTTFHYRWAVRYVVGYSWLQVACPSRKWKTILTNQMYLVKFWCSLHLIGPFRLFFFRNGTSNLKLTVYVG